MTMLAQDVPISRHSIAYGSERIDFTISFSERRQLAIIVDPSGTVSVRAPLHVGLPDILARVRRRSAWIVRQRDGFEAIDGRSLVKRFVNGETHRYLGRQYRLRISEGTPKSVKLHGRYFDLVVPDRKNARIVKQELDRWYRRRAGDVFTSSVERCLKSSYLRSLDTPPLSIRKMQRRWGSCTPSHSVLLNLDLIRTPVDCIDYVVAHELCHLIERHHGPEFYRLLRRVMPDWERRKRRLNLCEL